MVGYQTPLPTFRADMFELESRRQNLELLVPIHHNRLPTEGERDHSLWAVRGILDVGFEEKILLASNIGDVVVEEQGQTGPVERTIYGGDIAAMLASARLGCLAIAHPRADLFDGAEVEILMPQEAVRPEYERGIQIAEGISRAMTNGARPNHLAQIAEALSDGADLSVIGEIAPERTDLEAVPEQVAA